MDTVRDLTHVSGEHKTCPWSPAQELGSTSYSSNAKIGQGITQNLTRIFPIPVKNNNNKKN